MSNLSDKDIDRLSREAADSYEPDTSSLSWTRLEQKLKEQMPERPPDGFRFGRINPYIWGPAVVLLAGASFFFIKKNIYSEDSTRTNQQTVKTLPSTSANENPANGNTIHPDSLSSSGDAVAVDSTYSPSKEMAASNHSGPTLTNTIPDEDLNKSSGATVDRAGKVSKSEADDKNIGKKSFGTKVLVPAGAAAAGAAASNESAVMNSNQPFLSNDPAESSGNRAAFILPAAVSSGRTSVKVTQNDSLLNRISQSGIPTPHKSLRINRSLNIGFAFGPDYTDAGGITNDQLGNNIGITVGYYLTNKLSINTGIFYSNKFYWSPGHGTPNQPWSYTGGTGTVGSNAAPPAIEYVNGACNMYELPLTLRYDFAHNEKTKFFVNGGLSSYFMIKQTYINFFHSANRPVAYKTVDDEQVNYWFDVAAFSFGLETEIGKGFSFQAEPFFRLPLKDMGSQSLRLNTYGLMLSFRYTPVLSRSKK